jgi:hypothetical protein
MGTGSSFRGRTAPVVRQIDEIAGKSPCFHGNCRLKSLVYSRSEIQVPEDRPRLTEPEV